MSEQKYKNRKYTVLVTLTADPGPPPVLAAGVVDTGSVNIVNVPFILKKITHQIVGENGLGILFPQSMIQDNQYAIEWRTDQHNYQSEPVMAGAGYGTQEDHFNLETPEELAPKTTITGRITNQVQRTATIKVQLVFHGLEPIGEMKPS